MKIINIIKNLFSWKKESYNIYVQINDLIETDAFWNDNVHIDIFIDTNDSGNKKSYCYITKDFTPREIRRIRKTNYILLEELALLKVEKIEGKNIYTKRII